MRRLRLLFPFVLVLIFSVPVIWAWGRREKQRRGCWAGKMFQVNAARSSKGDSGYGFSTPEERYKERQKSERALNAVCGMKVECKCHVDACNDIQ